MKKLLWWIFFLSVAIGATTQLHRYQLCVIAFYNLENLYDTTDNPIVNDDEFTPGGDKRYTGAIYADKLSRLASVIRDIGSRYSPDGPAILGVAEIENDTVLTHLVSHPLLRVRQYQYIHYDSRDNRGVDVALLYQAKYFKPLASEPLVVTIPGSSKESAHTRDILYVQGLLDHEPVHIYVNHWPSRRGGAERSSPAREAAARVCRSHFEQILHSNPHARLLVMGDFNDDPGDKSIRNTLKAHGNPERLQPGELYNPWLELYQKGIGTLAYRDSWGLFDQVLLSPGWLLKNDKSFFFYRKHIYNEPYMMEAEGRYRGYPMRTWDGNHYRGGYSDHFPVFLVLAKRM